MRRLADARDLKLPTIYRLFANKQVLVDEMAEVIMGRVSCACGPFADWRDETTALAGALRGALLEQRDGARIVGGSYSARHNTLALADRMVDVAHRHGLRGERALWTATTVFCYVLGEVLEQQGADGVTITGAGSDAEALRSRYPNLMATPVKSLVDFDARFEFGITVIVAGLAAQAATTA